MDRAEGEVLLALDERHHARGLIWLGVAHLAAGVAGALLKFYVCLIVLVPLPIFVWVSLRSARRGLLFTTEGVVCQRGSGAIDFVPWCALRKVDFVVEEHEWEDRTRQSFLMTFDHGDFEHLRWRFQARPSPHQLKAIARVCRERDVAVGF